MNVKGRAKAAAFLAVPHILHDQGSFMMPKYYCNFTREIVEQQPEDVKGICRSCGVAKLK